jgi:hypothetical protein
MMHMDGSEPSGFADSSYRSGVVHEVPTPPLRCFNTTHEGQGLTSCSLYTETELNCQGLQYYSSTYNYICRSSLFSQEEECNCEYKVTCFLDLFLFAKSFNEFSDMFFNNAWVVFYWFNVEYFEYF